jgi:outer membrane lipoprotein-sorting protein
MKPILVALAALLATAGMAHADPASDIVAAADKVRNPGQPFRSTNTLTEYVRGKPSNQNVITVYSKLDPATHQYRNLVRYEQPARDAGKMVLLDRFSLWFYDPASRASVRISPQQRVTGQASVADVLNVNLAADYHAAIIGEETISDADKVPRPCTHLDLRAADDLATYNRVEYWVEKGTNDPIKAKVYADSGRLLKTLYYRGFKERAGAIRPSEAVIVDAVDPTLVTTLDFGELVLQDVPESWFQRENLARLQVK